MDLNFKRTGDVGLDANSYSDQLKKAAENWADGSYPRTVFIGLGGTGSKSLIELRRLILERYGAPLALEGISFLSIDTDLASIRPPAEDKRPHPLEAQLAFATDERLNLGGEEFKALIGANIVHNPHIRDWWDEAALPSDAFNPGQGAGQIRPLSRLLLFARKGEFDASFDHAYQKVTSQKVKSPRVNTAAKVRIVVIAGLAGGTGSGAFQDIGAMIQERLKTQGNFTLEAYLVTPGIFQSVEKSYPKAAANGFAALRELNHNLAHPFTARWGRNEEPVTKHGLFDRYILMTGTNAAGQTVASPGDCYRAIAESLFLDFGAGEMSGWVQGVRSNREQYLRSAVTYAYKLPIAGGGHKDTHADEWRNAFSSFGISKLVFPSWRLLNRAKYQLAGKMVELLDPGRRASIDDLITRHRNQFMYDAGFLQGELAGSSRSWLIRNRLARQTGAGPEISSVYDHLRKYEEELKAAAESMFTEKNTEAHAADIWLELAAHWGEPESKGNGGDWPNRITANRRALVKEVEEQLPRTIEDFRVRPAVGLSGCIAILRDILVVLEKPHDQALYRRWFQEKKADWDKARTNAERKYRDRIKRAHRASKGILAQQGPHELAVGLAAESFQEHWKARINLFLADEAVKAIDRIKRIVQHQLTRLEELTERMTGLIGEYRVRADFYAEPHASLLVKELEVPAGFDDLLSYYLGTQPEEREERLERLLQRGLRKMGLTTLEALEAKLTSDYEGFRDNLSAQAFRALRGSEGKTTHFSGEEEEPKDGFVERHSILKVLNQMDGAERRKLFKQLYDKGLPWVFQARDDALMSEQKPHGDSFLGLATPNDTVSGEMLDWLEQNTVPPYRRPTAVGTRDPAEIIFYTELNAFAVYYPSEVSDLRQKYDSFVNNDSVLTPLHLHQDWHTYQPPIPWKITQLASLQRAWKLLIKAQMLGVVRSISMRRDDDVRYTWQHRRVTGPFEVKWIDLGPEGHVIRRLMTDDQRSSRRLIADDVRQAQDRFIKSAGGSWAQLLALADYYYYCIFPVQLSQLRGGLNVTVGSMQNLVCTELRAEWRRQAMSAGVDPELVDVELKKLFDRLMKWTVPCYRDETHVVPATPSVPQTRRADDWLLMEPIGRQVEELCATGQLRSAYDHQGALMLEFPRLAIDWSFFEQSKQADVGGGNEPIDISSTGSSGQPAPSPGPEEARYYYGRGPEQLGELTVAQIVEHVVASPDLAHRVWKESFGAEWKLVGDVPEIMTLLPRPKSTMPPLPVGPPPLPHDA